MKGRKKGKMMRIAIIAAAAVVVAAAIVFVLGAKIFPGADPKDPVAVTTVKVTRADMTMTVSASGQFEPNTITTIRPDSNMPTRKIVRIQVKEGERVAANQALAQIDATGLDLSVKSAEANYQSQRVKLDNLKAKPVGMDVAVAEADLTTNKLNLDSQQDNYTNIKALAEQGLASKSQLADAERQLAIAGSKYEASRLTYQNVKAQSQDDVIQAQQAAFAQADNDLQMARIVLASATIRSPVSGVVAEVLVNVGDLVSPSTAIMTVVDPDPMVLQAQVNENDMERIKPGDAASVTPSGFPDMTLTGRVTQIDLHAQVQSNVSVFIASIEVPNKNGKILWGMNADATVTVLNLPNVLTLPSSSIRNSNGSSLVTILDEGKPVAWEVQTGVTDGSQTQILAGLDEGQEVVVQPRKAPAGTQGRQGQSNMGQVFRVLH